MFKPVDPHPNFAKLEEEVLKFWEDNKIFEKSLEQTRPKLDPRLRGDEKQKLFTFYDGPPFATGLPHYGHILASTIKDLVPRYQTMNGRFVRRRWGWDCHGLPIEEVVERQLGISGKKDIEKLGIKKFNETCRAMVLQYVAEWGKMVRRIARWVEFDNSYKTMDREYMESVWWAFKQVYEKGLVYEGRKVLLYCPRCETPVSNFEVAMDNSYQEVTEEAVTVKFRIKTNERKNGRTKEQNVHQFISSSVPTFLLAWTTTPWTLPGNVALAVGEDIDYVKVKVRDEFYIAARNLTGPSGTLSDIGEGRGEVTDVFKGADLVGLEYEPLYQVQGVNGEKRAHKVYAADFVNTEEGTGIVHTAVVYGEEDYEFGQKEGLPVVPLLDEKGVFNSDAPKLIQGQYFKDAEKVIKDDLQKRGLLFKREQHQHSYPHCWRCGTMLYYNAIPAWFVNVQKIKKRLLRSNNKEINWFPEHLKHGRYEKSVESAPDWNISRNRYWGNPMPVWRCTVCKKDTVIGSVAELQKKAATTPLKSPLLDLHRPYIDEVILKCQHCGGQARRITEIFDSWFEAGSMPFAEYHYPFENKEVFESRYPAQFVTEYIAQTRAWFYLMHVMGVILFDHAPFENVVTTGTILAEDGSKMSKSKKNYPDPWEVINKYGVDSLRWYLMNSVVMQADNLNFSEADLGVVNRKVFRILYNVYNYFVTYANEARWEQKNVRTEEPKNILDQWQNARLQQTISKVTEHLNSYDTVRATRELENFINDLSTWYLRRSRGRKDAEFFATLFRSLIYLSKLLAPVAPFMAEEIYQNLTTPTSSPPIPFREGTGGEREGVSVHLEKWPEAKKLTSEQEKLLKQMQSLREIVEQAHALRARAGIKLRQPLQRLILPLKVDSSQESVERSTHYGLLTTEFFDIVKDEINVKEVAFGDKLELDTSISEELKLEGLTRELERAINALRKEMGLRIGQAADLYYETNSSRLSKAIKQVDHKKTYISELGIRNQELGVDFQKQVDIEGESIKLSFKTIIPNS